MSPNRAPSDWDTPSPEPLFIHSCMSAGVPQKEPSYSKNIRLPSTVPHADGRPTYNGMRPGSPRGSFMTLQSLPQCHAAFGAIPSALAWVDQGLVSQRVSQKAPTGYTLHNRYRLPRDPRQSTNLRYPEVRTRGWIYGRQHGEWCLDS